MRRVPPFLSENFPKAAATRTSLELAYKHSVRFWLKTDLAEELKQRISITENGKPTKVSKQRALIKSLTAKAVSGDTKAISQLVLLIMKLNRPEEAETTPLPFTETDLQVLAEFEAEILKSVKSKGKKK